jgi:cytochrome c oxidase assembly factor CtaG
MPGTWRFDPVALGAAALALVLYGRAFTRLRARGRSDHASIANAALFGTGVATATLAVVTPLDALAEDTLLSAHMLQHLLIGDVAPLLLVLGARGPIALFLLPLAILRHAGRGRPLRRALSVVVRPWVSCTVWSGSLAAWHVPQAYDAALRHPALHVLEHASLFVGGLLLWTQIVDPLRRGSLSVGRRSAVAAGALLAGMGLSEVLLGSAPLYDHYASVTDRPLGMTQASDQARAGLLMMAEQVATFGTAAAVLAWSHVERVATELGKAAS